MIAYLAHGGEVSASRRSGDALSRLTPRRGPPLRTHPIWPESGPDSQTLGRSRRVRFTGAFGTDPLNESFDTSDYHRRIAHCAAYHVPRPRASDSGW